MAMGSGPVMLNGGIFQASHAVTLSNAVSVGGAAAIGGNAGISLSGPVTVATSGSVHVAGGTPLTLMGGGNSSGMFVIDPSATLSFPAATPALLCSVTPATIRKPVGRLRPILLSHFYFGRKAALVEQCEKGGRIPQWVSDYFVFFVRERQQHGEATPCGQIPQPQVVIGTMTAAASRLLPLAARPCKRLRL
jgi:hypothetical protein